MSIVGWWNMLRTSHTICPLQSFDVFVQEKGDEKLGLGTEEEGGRWMGRNRGGGDERGEMKRRMG